MASSNTPIILPKQGVARVKSVMSGDTVILLGKPLQPNQPPPEVVFTLESLSAPRLASKTTPSDEPGAFEAREWLRRLVVGKQVKFETRKQGASAGDRVYGWLYSKDPAKKQQQPDSDDDPFPLHVAVECVRAGHATPKSIKFPGSVPGAGTPKASDDKGDNGDKNGEQQQQDGGGEPVSEAAEYESMLAKAYEEARERHAGIHSADPGPVVRKVKNAVDDFAPLALAETCRKHASHGRVKCVIEYVFDGSRYRCQVVDAEQLPDYRYASFTMLLAGVTCPRLGNSRTDPPAPAEDFAEEARNFVQARLLQRELDVTLLGADKAGMSCVGMVHHPAGNIAVELLKNGLARMTDWSVRLMPVEQVPALRVAENSAKRSLLGVWKDYAPPVLQSASSVAGTVVEVVSGDTLLVLPAGKAYDSEDVLMKVSLASVRAPRAGNERAKRPDEPYSWECKERLRALAMGGKQVRVETHYERDIPLSAGGATEKRPFGTVSTEKVPCIGLTLISEGLAVTQRHRDDDERSPRYDEMCAHEAAAKEGGKGVHSDKPYKRAVINDLTEQRKAKAYSGSLMRAGKLKAVVDYVFNGALLKLFVPAENCHIRFAPNYVRCPQPSPSPGSKVNKPAEPFGDNAKRFSRLHLLQRPVEINCTGVTNGGVILGDLFALFPAKRDYTMELLGAGLATLDQRKLDYGEVPKTLVDAQAAAVENKVGIWSVPRTETSSKTAASAAKTVDRAKEQEAVIRLSEIRSGNHFFFHTVGDEACKVMEDSMKLFTENNGTSGGAPADVKVGKVVAALFGDGADKSWYRAKVLEKKAGNKVQVLFVDYGNVATVSVASHVRPLDASLGIDRIAATAKEAVLALTVVRPVDDDVGLEAARALQRYCWGQDLKAVLLAPDENGKLAVKINLPNQEEESVNSIMVSTGLARSAKRTSANILAARMVDDASVQKLAKDVAAAEESARKTRSGMWRYGDVGDDDDDE